jgi:hypothetical protein
VSSKRVQKFAIAFASGVAVLVVASAVASAGGDDGKTATPSPKPNAAPTAPAKTEGDTNPQPDPVRKTPLQEFQACVAKGGTATEKAAVKHVVKLSGMDDWNGILDNPKAFTDYMGGIRRGADATLIASAFADCYKSDNGLLTVYTSDGHVAGNGQF